MPKLTEAELTVIRARAATKEPAACTVRLLLHIDALQAERERWETHARNLERYNRARSTLMVHTVKFEAMDKSNNRRDYALRRVGDAQEHLAECLQAVHTSARLLGLRSKPE